MLRSRLFHCFYFLIGQAATEAWAFKEDAANAKAVTLGDADPQDDGIPVLRRLIDHVEHVVVIVELEEKPGVYVEQLPEVTPTPAQEGRTALEPPQPTAPPNWKRQDNGQIQALNGEIQRLSGSVARLSLTISAISQASQTQSQTLNDVIRSERQVQQQLNTAVTAAQSAAALATANANDRLASATASFNMQLSSAQADMRSSVSSTVASVLASATAQIQQAQAEAAAAKNGASNLVSQVQSSSVSVTNVIIIVVASVLGAAFITAIAAWIIVRSSRAKQRARILAEVVEKPYSSRGRSQGRYTPDYPGSPDRRGTKGRYTSDYANSLDSRKGYPLDKDGNRMDKLALADMGLSATKPANFEKGRPMTATTYTLYDGANGRRSSLPSPSLKPQNDIQNVERVRLIRVGTGKTDESLPPPPALPPPDPPNSKAKKQQTPEAATASESNRYTLPAEGSRDAGSRSTETSANPPTKKTNRFTFGSMNEDTPSGAPTALKPQEQPQLPKSQQKEEPKKEKGSQLPRPQQKGELKQQKEGQQQKPKQESDPKPKGKGQEQPPPAKASTTTTTTTTTEAKAKADDASRAQSARQDKPQPTGVDTVPRKLKSAPSFNTFPSIRNNRPPTGPGNLAAKVLEEAEKRQREVETLIKTNAAAKPQSRK